MCIVDKDNRPIFFKYRVRWVYLAEARRFLVLGLAATDAEDSTVGPPGWNTCQTLRTDEWSEEDDDEDS